MELKNIDFTKLFDATLAIDNMEKGANAFITYLPEQVRETAYNVSDAQIKLMRSTNKAVKQFAETVDSFTKDAQKEFAKNVEKVTKVAA